MMKLLGTLFFICTTLAIAQGGRILHVSAWPTGTEIYVGEDIPNFTNAPDYTTPASIPVSDKNEFVRITLFKSGFRDSTIDVTVPNLDSSYLMVILQEEHRSHALERQDAVLTKRSQKKVGNWMTLSSIIPYGIAVATFILNANANSNAEDIKKDLSKHKIESEKTASLKHDLKEERHDAENYRKATLWSAGIGTAILAVGLYLRF